MKIFQIGWVVMGDSKRRRHGKGRQRNKAVFLLAALVVLAVGLCLFHPVSNEITHHGMSPEMCATLLIALGAPVLLTRPGMSGWLVPVPRRPFRGLSPDLFDRPPELVPFS